MSKTTCSVSLKLIYLIFCTVGGADADDLKATYEGYTKNWHDDLLFYDEEF